jgi:parallel beta-helix repeat protein
MNRRTSLAWLLGALALACSSDSKKTVTAPDGGNEGGSPHGEGGACTTTLSPGSDGSKTIQDAFNNAKSGDTICLSPGTYTMNRIVTLEQPQNVTVRGTGAAATDVVLDFTNQIEGQEGVLVSTDGFTIENLWIKNTVGHGIKVQADNSTFRGIKVSWETASTSNGGYAIYPTGCNHTLLEDNEVTGASDAGIYAGQCQNVIARRNKSHGNVLGIEVENTTNAEVYGNEVYDNTTGFLLDLLPNLQKKDAKNYLVHDNNVHDNNRKNFAVANSLAAVAPEGTGILVLASTDVEIKNNQIANHTGVPVLIVSYDIIDIIQNNVCPIGDAGVPDSGACRGYDVNTNRWPERVFVHDNTYTNNGYDPQGVYSVFVPASDGGKKSIPYDVLWDGILKKGTPDIAAAQICLGATEAASFVDFNPLSDPTKWSTDPAPHQCTLPGIPPLSP